ncbi:MAG: DUF3352 domain-containing protein [Cyanobacteria bacterium P01_D01_bin.156]
MVLKQRPPLLLTAGTAVLLILGGAAAYLGINERLFKSTQLPSGMELVPSDALLALTLTTDENQWTRLRQMGSAESQKILDRWLLTWRDRILSNHGYRYRTDIEPWIADQVTVAFLPKTDAGEGAADLVLLIPIADPLKAQELLSKPKDDVTWVGRDYKNATIQSITTANGDTFESTVLANKWLVVAASVNSVETVIDRFEGAIPSLLENGAYVAANKTLDMPSGFAQVYVNAPVAAEVFTGSDTLPGINGVAAVVSLLPNGFDIEAASWLGPEDQPVYRDIVNRDAWTPERLPESTVLMMSTGNIGALWQSLAGAEGVSALLPIAPDTLAQGLKQRTGLDFENDILPWLGEEMTFGLWPPAVNAAAMPMGQLALVAEVTDREAAESTWSELNEVMTNRFRFDVESVQSGEQPINQLVSYYGGIAMGHGWLDQDITFFGVGEDVVDAIAPQPSQTLQTNPSFQTLLDISPQETSGYFFADIARMQELQGMLPFPTLPDAPVVSAIQSIGVTTSVQNERTLRYDIFVELPKGRRVKPLPGGNVSQNEVENTGE